MRLVEFIYDWLATPSFLGLQRFEWIMNVFSLLMFIGCEILMAKAIIGIMDGNVY